MVRVWWRSAPTECRQGGIALLGCEKWRQELGTSDSLSFQAPTPGFSSFSWRSGAAKDRNGSSARDLRGRGSKGLSPQCRPQVPKGVAIVGHAALSEKGSKWCLNMLKRL